jgi:hypothetical protein
MPRRNPAGVDLDGCAGCPSPAAEGAADRGECAGRRVLRASDGHGAEVDAVHSGHVEQLFGEPDRRVEWVCVAGHANWQDNGFTFALHERKGETLVMFSQDYARELSDEVYGIYNFNWGYYLNSLIRTSLVEVRHV